MDYFTCYYNPQKIISEVDGILQMLYVLILQMRKLRYRSEI